MAARSDRELVFTTLIDLLVQIIFIFTLVLVVIPGTEKASANDNVADPSPFDHLVPAIYGQPPPVSPSVDEMARKANETRVALESMRTKNRELQAQLAKTAAKKVPGEGAAPGLERCTVAGRQGRPLLLIGYSGKDRFSATPLVDSKPEYTAANVSEEVFMRGAPWSSLRSRLEAVAAAGKNRQCTFVLQWQHDPGLDADEVLGARANVEQLFYLTRPVSKSR